MEQEGLLVLPMTTPFGTTGGALQRARTGDLVAFEVLMRDHERQVLRVALRLTGNVHDAQDAAQDVFLRLHRNLGSFAEAAGIAPWLYRVTVNVCADITRRKKSSRMVPIAEMEAVLAAGTMNPEVQALRREDEGQLSTALAALGERERTALVLRDLEGMSTAEVAEMLGSAESTIRVQISKARLKLRELLGGLRR